MGLTKNHNITVAGGFTVTLSYYRIEEINSCNCENKIVDWVASTAYSTDDQVRATGSYDGYIFTVTDDGGTSGASEPTWVKTVDSDTTDNNITWTCGYSPEYCIATIGAYKDRAAYLAGETPVKAQILLENVNYPLDIASQEATGKNDKGLCWVKIKSYASAVTFDGYAGTLDLTTGTTNVYESGQP